MKYQTIITLILFAPVYLMSQGSTSDGTIDSRSLPYHEIPAAPTEYTATTVVARMIDGLGFRYYWATEGLREEDLAYKGSESSRTSIETLYHIHGLTEVIYNSISEQPSIRPLPEMSLTFEELREKTLVMLKASSDILRAADPDALETFKIIFQRGDNQSEFPFWNQLNGPIADAIWHVGQIVALRRASGNPFNFRVSVFNGKVREG